MGLATAMNTQIIGSGSETLILAHGFGGDQSMWDKILPYLTKNYKVVVFDWSFSSAIKDPNLFDPEKYSSYNAFADDLIALMDELNLSSSVYIGHSMAAMIGCIASTKKPLLFQRLILIGASPSINRYLNAENYEGGFENSDIEQILSNIETNFYVWASHFPHLVIDANDSLSIYKFKNCLRKMKPATALSVAKLIFLSDERDILEKVVTPSTIIQTTNDIVVPNSVAYYLQKKIKDKSTVEIIETDGHFPQLTAHLQLLDVLGGVLGFDL